MEMKSAIPFKNEKTASRIIQDQAVIVILENQETVVLNESASRIWELSDGKRTLGEIARILEEEFSVSAQTALQDAAAFLGEAEGKGIFSLNRP